MSAVSGISAHRVSGAGIGSTSYFTMFAGRQLSPDKWSCLVAVKQILMPWPR